MATAHLSHTVAPGLGPHVCLLHGLLERRFQRLRERAVLGFLHHTADRSAP